MPDLRCVHISDIHAPVVPTVWDHIFWAACQIAKSAWSLLPLTGLLLLAWYSFSLGTVGLTLTGVFALVGWLAYRVFGLWHTRLWWTARQTWEERFDELRTRILEQQPHLIIVTGDLIDNSIPLDGAREALERLRDQLIAIRRETSVIFIPGNHDVIRFQGIGVRSETAFKVFADVLGDRLILGWNWIVRNPDQTIAVVPEAKVLPEQTRLVRVFGADSNFRGYLAQQRIPEESFRDMIAAEDHPKWATYPRLLLVHTHLYPEPRRTGENPITASEDTLGNVGGYATIKLIAKQKFDIVLHGHRHLTTAHRYADPESDARGVGTWFIGAAGATEEIWPGLNVIEFHFDGSFEVKAINKVQGHWQEASRIAYRDYEEVRYLRWHRSNNAATPGCSTLRLDLLDYTTDSKRKLSYRVNGESVFLRKWDYAPKEPVGDVFFRITIDQPRPGKTGLLPVPIRQLAGYQGAYLRDAAGLAYGEDRAPCPVVILRQGDGEFAVQFPAESRRIILEGVYLNAVPDRAGNWRSMGSCDGTLRHIFRLDSMLQCRNLEIDVKFQSLRRMEWQFARSDGTDIVAERPFVHERLQKRKLDPQRLTVFRPQPHGRYEVQPIGDPAKDGEHHDRVSPEVERLRKAIAELRPHGAARGPLRYARVQLALDDFLLGTTKSLFSAFLHRDPTDDEKKIYSVDLLCVPDGVDANSTSPSIRIAVTDSRTESARQQSSRADHYVKLQFYWGEGVAGRCLRRQKWLGWKNEVSADPQYAWPAKDFFARKGLVEGMVYCGPLRLVLESPRKPSEAGSDSAERRPRGSCVALICITTDSTESILNHLLDEKQDADMRACVAQLERESSNLAQALVNELRAVRV